jgi:ABC-type antimicrobial peptide transport system permease subunit
VKIGSVDGPWWTVVGVVGDVHHIALDESPDMQMYMPHQQWMFPDTQMTFVIRVGGQPSTVASAALRAIHQLDVSQPLSQVMPMTDYVGLSVQDRRFSLVLIGAFAATALLLSLIGIYGITSYTVARRTREIGIRIALGARHREVLALLLRQSMTVVVIGVVAGIAASIALTRFLASMLFEIRPADPLTLASVVISLIMVAALACWIPARRAVYVDPVVALRNE